MTRFLFTTLLIIYSLAPTKLISQDRFMQGWIVNQKNDTIRGLVEYQLAHEIVQGVKFKPLSHASATYYDPDEIQGFGFINGRYFIAKEVNSNGLVNQKVFVDVLVSGLANLYRLGKNFLLETDEKIHPLVEETREVIDQNVYYEHKDKKYVGTLNYVLRQCSDDGLRKRIQSAKLNENSLVTIVDQYNRCKTGTSKIIKVTNSKETVIRYSIIGGVAKSQMKFISGYSSTITNRFKTISTSNPIVGLGISFTNPQKIEGLFLGVELYGSNESFKQFYSSDDIISERFQLDYLHMKVNLNLKYNIIHGRVEPYFKGGISINQYFNGKLKTTQVLNNTNQTYREYSGSIDGTLLLQLMVGAGFDIRLNENLSSFIEIRADGVGGDHNSNLFLNSSTVGITAKSLKTTIYAIQFGIIFKR